MRNVLFSSYAAEDREGGSCRTAYRSYVIDDGWHLPTEIVEAIDLQIQKTLKQRYREICREHDLHRGDWLTADAAGKYEAKSWIYRVWYDNQYIGEVREIGEELQKEYGVTELEAINILNGRNVADYVNKYYRMQHRIPLAVDQQAICDEVAHEYLAAAM